MRKKILALCLAVCTILSFTACGEEDSKETTTSTASDLAEEGKITLGEYKGLVVYSDDITITDSELESYTNERLSVDSTTEYRTEGVVAEGDKVKVAYKGTVDGEEFTGGTSEGRVISISDTGFDVEGFTDGLIGHSIGETVELDLKFADDYSDEALQGKDVHYSVKLDSLVITVVPELTDEYVAAEYSEIGITTVGEFTEYLRNDLYINNIYSQIWSQIVEDTTVEAYEKEKFEEYVKIYAENEEYGIYAYYGYTLDDYLSLMGITESDWLLQIEASVRSSLKEEMILEEIAEIEGIEVSDEEFNKKMFEYAKLYGFDSVEEFKKSYSNIDDEDFKFSVKAYLVQEFLAKSVTVKEGSNPDNETTTVAQ